MGKYSSIEKAMEHAGLSDELACGIPEGHLRVAAYCRISMDSEGQSTSIELQEAVYRQMIQANEDWEFAGIFSDTGKTGTLAKRRPGFQQMIKACEEGKIDLIITKSLSRFSRNTMECIYYIREVQNLGVQIRFEKERITTGEVCSELLLTVLAAFAQEESRSMSENIKWGFRKRFENGHEKYTALYGYRQTEDDNYEIIPEEADVVRLIFNLYETGLGTGAIATELNRRGIPSPRDGKKGWDNTRTSYIIRNRRYTGDTFMQKYYTKDHITHKIMKNNGEYIQYFVENHHEPIVSKKQFERVQKIFAMRSGRDGIGQYPVGDRFRCPYCGSILKRRRLPIQKCETHLCCENAGDGCRKFVIRFKPIEKAILDAYRDFDMGLLSSLKDEGSDAAARFFELKKENPEFSCLDYYWMDDLIDHFELGKHTYSESELKEMTNEDRIQNDDRWISIYWKCGVKTILSSGVKRDSQHPKHIAELWDGYVMRYPDRYPEVTKQVMDMKEGETGE